MKSANLLFIILKALQRKGNKKKSNLESELKKLEVTLDDANNLGEYNSIKNELDTIYDHIAEGIRVTSKWD